jgi:hypothetical protein
VLKTVAYYKNICIKAKSPQMSQSDSSPRKGPILADHLTKKYSPETAQELDELCKLYSKQKRSLLSHRTLSATPKQTTQDQNVRALPAPARFTRKAKPEAAKRGVCPTGLACACPSESLHRSSQHSCETSPTLSDNAYDTLLQKLMYSDGSDYYQFDEGLMGTLDAQLNEAS